MSNGRCEASIPIKTPYLLNFPAILFAAWLFSFFLSNRRQSLYAVLISPPSDIAGTPCHPVFHNIANPKLYLYLINNNTMMVCGGSVEVHRRTFSSFPSVTWVVSLALCLFTPGKEPTIPRFLCLPSPSKPLHHLSYPSNYKLIILWAANSGIFLYYLSQNPLIKIFPKII